MIARNLLHDDTPWGDVPGQFGWVLRGYVERLQWWDHCRRRAERASCDEARHLAQADAEAAKAEVRRYKDEMVRGWLWCLRMAAEIDPGTLAAVLGRFTHEAAGRQADAVMDALRERVLRLEREVSGMRAQNPGRV